MTRTPYEFRRVISALALAASVAAVAVPAAAAVGPGSPGILPSQLGSQDPRDSAQNELFPSSIAARDLGSPDVRDAVGSIQPTTIPSTDGFDWGRGGIEIAVAVCGLLLLLVALGIGTRRLHHGGHRLGSA